MVLVWPESAEAAHASLRLERAGRDPRLRCERVIHGVVVLARIDVLGLAPPVSTIECEPAQTAQTDPAPASEHAPVM